MGMRAAEDGQGTSAPAHPSRVDEWDPSTYEAFTSGYIGPVYGELHDAVLGATVDRRFTHILDLGTGTGEAARRLLAAHGEARLVGLDANRSMLRAAGASLPAERVRLLQGRLEEPLPTGPFDLVVSVLAVHHLDGRGKADLFRRIHDVLEPNGRFVLGDAVADPAAPKIHRTVAQRFAKSIRDVGAVGTIAKLARRARDSMPGRFRDFDEPDLLVDQLDWLKDAGFDAEVFWQQDYCAVVRADRRAPASGRQQAGG